MFLDEILFKTQEVLRGVQKIVSETEVHRSVKKKLLEEVRRANLKDYTTTVPPINVLFNPPSILYSLSESSEGKIEISGQLLDLNLEFYKGNNIGKYIILTSVGVLEIEENSSVAKLYASPNAKDPREKVGVLVVVPKDKPYIFISSETLYPLF